MIDSHTAMSFQEWSDAGYLIHRGEKSQFRDENGVPQFRGDQVHPKPSLPGSSFVPMEYANTPWQRPRGAPGPVPPPVLTPVPPVVPEAPVPRPEFTIPDPI